jgi:DNA-directed RNA polymerase specialized sigma24 family protein
MDNHIGLDAQRSPEGYACRRNELRGRLERGCRGWCPPILREALVLRDAQGLNNEEAAAASGISGFAFKARLRRGQIMPRKHLQDYLRQAQ